ncbi:MAG TPA: glutaminase A [Candidatus Acidoferrales bacterium]|nr:glutaminase A [Candidatus Acidoferrales bacterium]
MNSQRVLARLFPVVLFLFAGCAEPVAHVSASPAPATVAAAPPAANAGDLQRLVNEAHAKFQGVTDGAPADYIPELAKVPADLFGVAIVTAQGDVYTAGDVDYSFSIQSVSKPFTAALVMQQQGSDAIAQKIGVEPTGLKFNSIMATQIIPQVSVNPLVNSGAIASVSMVQAKNAKARFNTILDFFDRLSASKLKVLDDIYKSEAATNQRNRAHAYILAASERIYSDPMEATDVYTKQCSIGVTAKQLGIMGATLANNGINPLTHERLIDAKYVPKVLAIMMMAGFYNESGMWAYTAGLPAKTGVGGGIVAVVPGKMAIVGFSPRLNDAGNSIRATKAIEYIVDQLGVNLFGSGR